MADRVTQEQENTLATGAQHLAEGGQGINERVKALMGELEQDYTALQGNALRAFREGQGELVAGMEALTNWCSQYGVNLNLGQARFNETDADTESEYTQASSDLSNVTLSRSPNA